MGESLVRVVLAHGEVDVFASQEVLHHANQDFEVLIYLFVSIILLKRLAIAGEALESLQEFDHEASRFSVHDKAIDGPSIELQSIGGIVHELKQQLENQLNDLVVAWIAVDVQALLDDRKGVRVEPIEGQGEGLVAVGTSKQSAQDVKQLQHLDPHRLVRSHLVVVLELQDFVDGRA